MPDIPVRRPPPPFRTVTVRCVRSLTPRMSRVTLSGPELGEFEAPGPAASVRLLLPAAKELVIPDWNGNEFLLPDGTRPPIRTFTPRRFDPMTKELDVDVVLHGRGLASGWATNAAPGDPVAVSGPGRAYWNDPDAPAFLLLGDETALPAIGQLLGLLPPVPRTVHLEVEGPSARFDLGDDVEWHVRSAYGQPGSTLVEALQQTSIAPGTRIWAAGEAASMQRIRKHLFNERAVSRSDATIRGYWKHVGGSGG